MRYVPPVAVDRVSRSRNVKRRPRNRRKLSLRALKWLFLVPTARCGVVSYAFQTPALVVRKVRIEGVRLADHADVECAARAALGRNILLVRTGPITKAIRRLPEVASVRLARSFPDGISVAVQERKPEAVVSHRASCCMVQADCLAFHRTDGPVRGLPTVQVARSTRVREGEICLSADVANALEVLKCARKCELSVAKISVDPFGDMCLNMGSGFYVKLGQPDDIAQKMSVLRTALTYRPSIASEAAYIDLSCPSAPVWKPKSAS